MEIKINEKKINYLIEGDGKETVVLLHGWGANIQTMLPISKILSDKYRTILIDLPGFGESEKPDEVLNSFDYAKIIIKILDELKIDKAIFIGHSFGGKISAIISSLYKDRVIKTVLIDAAGIKPKRSITYYLKVYRFKFLKKIYMLIPASNKYKNLEKFYKKFGSDDYQAANGVMRKILVTVVNEDIKPLLKDIDCEVLLIWGDNDDATPLYMGKTFEKEIKNGGLVVLENAGHFSYIDNYSVFRAVINSYLNQGD